MDEYFPNEKQEKSFLNIIFFRFSALLKYEEKSKKDEEKYGDTRGRKEYFTTYGRRFLTYALWRIKYYVLLYLLIVFMVALLNYTFNFPIYSFVAYIKRYLTINYATTIIETTKFMIFLLPLVGMLFVSQVKRVEEKVWALNNFMRDFYEKISPAKCHAVNVSDCKKLMDEIIDHCGGNNGVSREASRLKEESEKTEKESNYLRYLTGNSLAFLTVVLLISIILVFMGNPIDPRSCVGLLLNSSRSVFVAYFFHAILVSMVSLLIMFFL